MLSTSRITKQLKDDMLFNGYNYVTPDMKIKLLTNAVKNDIATELNIKDRGQYSLLDLVMLLDTRTRFYADNQEIFSSYIYSILNIIGEIQGRIITIVYSDTEEISRFKSDSYGFSSEFISPRRVKPANVMLELINCLDDNSKNKLLVK